MSALEKVLALEPLQFRYISAIDPQERKRAGFSAQQIRQVVPEAVVEVNGVLMVDPAAIRNLIRQAIAELSESRF